MDKLSKIIRDAAARNLKRPAMGRVKVRADVFGRPDIGAGARAELDVLEWIVGGALVRSPSGVELMFDFDEIEVLDVPEKYQRIYEFREGRAWK